MGRKAREGLYVYFCVFTTTKVLLLLQDRVVRGERPVKKASKVQPVHKVHAVTLVDKARLVRLVRVELLGPRDG